MTTADDAPPLNEEIANLALNEIEGPQSRSQTADVFERFKGFRLVEQVRALGLYPFFLPIEVNEGPEAIIDGKRVLMLGSNNYLGLTRHPKVLAAAKEALERYGPSMTGSRLLNGTSVIHEQLEERIASFLGWEAALICTTGYQANLCVISALVDRGVTAVIDKMDHASIYDAAALALGESVRFRHNDVAHLEEVLRELPETAGRLVIVDGVYSMGGDIAPLPEIAAVCQRYKARLVVDDAHAIGTVGDRGTGTPSHFGITEGVDIVVGTFSKSLASVGGFCAGPKYVLEHIKHFARPMIFTAAPPPASAAAALAAIECIEEEPWRVARVKEIGARVRVALREMGFNIGATETPIVPIIIGSELKTALFWRDLLDNGIYTNAVVVPAVPRGQSSLRTSYVATHSDEQIESALERFGELARKHGIID